ncbi:hypothetical protein IVB30_39875 [Bradyrhizobium sp. 200]|uniref:hypothetical protein n=1 Tax=Bradyrhizobium sp. 200 TaxID=2782665 RepID=UPI001FFF0CCF|nr:hypothetical protein [Bradyrhizobium sp. 200]UPJ49069.1 hypothetical protein IVB30_39875 [Bradyrhizobium sp. 200]
MKDLVGWLEAGSVEAPPICAFPFESFLGAFGAISSRHALGKVVVEMNNHHITG